MDHLSRHLALGALVLGLITGGAAPAMEDEPGQARTHATGIHGHPHSGEQSGATARERAALLKCGEAALSSGDTDAAAQAFERAGLIQHSADAEMGLARTYMQMGEYRRALTFAAHTAGAHPDEPEGVALYAWLLHVGGQGLFAQRLLAEAETRLPHNPVLAAVRKQLRVPYPLPSGRLSIPPTRFAPYGASEKLPSSARVVGTGVLIDQGRRALVPIAALARGTTIWMRNAVGQMAQAAVERRLADEKMAVLRLARPLPVRFEPAIAPRDAFPGSIAYTVEYAASGKAAPAWPLLSAGFVGRPIGDGVERELGIDLPKGPRGGPVFDAMGRLAGMAMSANDGRDRLVPASRLRKSAAGLPALPAQPVSGVPVSMDEIYEAAMQTTVQVIAAH